MANPNYSSFNRELWSRRTQTLLKSNLVGGAIASTEESGNLTDGKVVHRPYHGEIYAQDYTKYTDLTGLAVPTYDEYLTIDQAKAMLIPIDRIDKIQNYYDTQEKLTTRSAYELRNCIDQKILSTGVSGAALARSAAVSLSTTNVGEEFSKAKAALRNNRVEQDRAWFAVIDPDTQSLIEQLFMYNGFKKSDDTLEYGFGVGAGDGWGIDASLGQFIGLDCYFSQNLPSSVTLGLATTPTDGDTVVINGITFTFKTALAAVAGQVLIGGSASAANTNLAKAVNGSGTVDTHYVELSWNNRANLKRNNVVAVAGAASTAFTAAGKMVLSETFADPTDAWGAQTINTLVGRYGCIDLVIQQEVQTLIKEIPAQTGFNILTWDLYGAKMFNEGAQKCYKLPITVS